MVSATYSDELEQLARSKLQQEKDMLTECDTIERLILEVEHENVKVLQQINDKAAQSRKEIAELMKMQESVREQMKFRNEEIALQEKKLEEALQLITTLKSENQKARKENEKYRSKYDGISNNNHMLEGSNRDFSESCNIAEELAIMEQSSNDVMMSDYDRTKALNIELKAKFREEQDNYLEVANARLDLQKKMKNIMIIIDQSENKPNHLIAELNSIVAAVEVSAKAEMSELEAQLSDTDTGECTDSDLEYETSDD